MKKFTCDSGNGPLDIEAEAAQEAARYYAESKFGGRSWKTVFVTVRVGEPIAWGSTITEETEDNCFCIPVYPEDPDCTEKRERKGKTHKWSEAKIYGSVGSTARVEHCKKCGVKMVIDNWATNPETGQQGLRSVEYSEAS